MNPADHKTLEIARRTRKNLEFIDAQKAKGADVEEFTHLLNSMLGMLVCLREEYLWGREVTWDSVTALGLKKASIDEDPRSTTFSMLVRRLRNGLVHNNFELTGHPEINGVRLWNVPTGTPPDKRGPENWTWTAKLPEQSLREVAYLVNDYIEKDLGRHA
jgi:hypothetical protein